MSCSALQCRGILTPLLVMAASAVVSASLPARAGASSVHVEGSGTGGPVFHYVAAAGEANLLSITESGASESGTAITVESIVDSVSVSVGAGCSQTAGDPRRAVCRLSGPEGQSRVRPAGKITLGDGNDQLTMGGTEMSLWGLSIDDGPGDDQASVASGAVFLNGPGNDILGGGEESNSVKPGLGNDRIYGGRHPFPGTNDLNGGAGHDVIYGGAGDGEAISGGAGNDRLYGGADADRLSGGAGSDRLFGGPGNDRLLGGPGLDLMLGGPGRDLIDGLVRDFARR